MSYLRGNIYIWPSHAHMHFWSATGDDGWRESDWAGSYREHNADTGGPSGVGLPQDVIDESVVMRFAEVLDNQRLRDTIGRALTHARGNGGSVALQKHADRIHTALTQAR